VRGKTDSVASTQLCALRDSTSPNNRKYNSVQCTSSSLDEAKSLLSIVWIILSAESAGKKVFPQALR
jgi:hypothetical protein